MPPEEAQKIGEEIQRLGVEAGTLEEIMVALGDKIYTLEQQRTLGARVLNMLGTKERLKRKLAEVTGKHTEIMDRMDAERRKVS
jgi:hypothetical protein